VPLTVQYRITNLKDFILNVADPEVSLQHATDSVVRHVVGSTDMDQVLTQGREVMSVEVHQRLQQFMDTYQTGITITQLNLQSATAPSEVIEAFDDVIRAREDEQRERNQAESYANSIIPLARGLAARAIEDANAYKDEVIAKATGEAKRFEMLLTEYRKEPEVTRKRLYLDAMQEVMANSSKILLPNQEAGNSMFYLPLDKIFDKPNNVANSTKEITHTEVANNAKPKSQAATNFSNNDVRTRGGR
jgi:membrane protease subunit HflK